MKTIETKKAPAAIGPYSQAILKDNLLFLSGQIGLNPATGEMEPTFELQARRVFTNLQAVLEAAEMSFRNVVKSTVFLKDMNHFGEMNAIYDQFVKPPYPARETVQAARLPKDAFIEVSLVAMK